MPFTTKNQPDPEKKKRGKAEKTKILDALHRASKTENDFFDLLVSKAFNSESEVTFNEVLKRLAPLHKQVAPPIEFTFPENDPPHKQAAAVMKAVSLGQVPPDLGHTFVTSIKYMIEIEESTDLKERIKKLEASLGLE